MTTDAGAEAPAAIGLVERLLGKTRPIIALTVDILSLAGVLAFVVAVALNQLVFAEWGLNFLQVATPSDVIMSGLQMDCPQ